MIFFWDNQRKHRATQVKQARTSRITNTKQKKRWSFAAKKFVNPRPAAPPPPPKTKRIASTPSQLWPKEEEHAQDEVPQRRRQPRLCPKKPITPP